MNNIYHLLLLLFTVSCFSQTSLKGKILDTDNNPVAFASLYLPESKKGTITNEDGDFYININPDIDKELLVSHLNYKDVKVRITDSSVKIVLEQKEMVLEELVVGNPLTAYDIAIKVIENLDKNHKVEPAHYEYFRRVVDYQPDLKSVNLIQEYYGKVLHPENYKAKVNIKKCRAVTYTEAGEALFNSLQMHDFYIMINDNMLLYKPAVLKKSNLKKYTLALEGTTTLNGVECYIIKYTNEDAKYSDDKRGVVYVDMSTYGIAKLLSGAHAITPDKWSVERNFNYINNKWVLSSVTDRRLTGKKPSVYTTLYTYLDNAKDYEGEDLKAIATGLSQKLKKSAKDPNDSFWDNYNHIPLPEN